MLMEITCDDDIDEREVLNVYVIECPTIHVERTMKRLISDFPLPDYVSRYYFSFVDARK